MLATPNFVSPHPGGGGEALLGQAANSRAGSLGPRGPDDLLSRTSDWQSSCPHRPPVCSSRRLHGSFLRMLSFNILELKSWGSLEPCLCVTPSCVSIRRHPGSGQASTSMPPSARHQGPRLGHRSSLPTGLSASVVSFQRLLCTESCQTSQTLLVSHSASFPWREEHICPVPHPPLSAPATGAHAPIPRPLLQARPVCLDAAPSRPSPGCLLPL